VFFFLNMCFIYHMLPFLYAPGIPGAEIEGILEYILQDIANILLGGNQYTFA